MNDVSLQLNSEGRGSFFIDKEGERLAEMVVRVDEKNMTVFHTEVSEKLRGQGVAGQLLSSMVAYAREHQLKVTPLCSYVAAQFKQHPEQYADILNKDWHSKT